MEMQKAACECEYPCSCVDWRGQTFTSPGELVDFLSRQLDDAEKEISDMDDDAAMRHEPLI